MENIKTVLLDTNVLISDPNAISTFHGKTVILAFPVLEELDKLKTARGKQETELNYQAREVIRILENYRQSGNLLDGIKIENDITLKVVDIENCAKSGTAVKAEDYVDNKFLRYAIHLKRECESKLEEQDFIFITKDISLRLKFSSYGLKTDDYVKNKKDQVEKSIGYCTFDLNLEQIENEDYINSLIAEYKGNERYLVFNCKDSPKKSFVCKYFYEEEAYIDISAKFNALNIVPKSMEQKVAMDMLLDDKIKVVSLTGQAGCGKSILALSCALKKVVEEQLYEKVVVIRSVVPADNEAIGFLPGTINEKISPMFGNIYGILKYLQKNDTASSTKKGKSKIPTTKEEKKLEDFVEIMPITFLRGMSIHNSVILLDDFQNVSASGIKTILSRVGENTKVILTSDVKQIDNIYNSEYDNAISYMESRFGKACESDGKLEASYSRMELRICERSFIADCANKYL